ncbi:CDP-diacylglycerol--glycerol-3-phosphate 3-phosphatidyltransferase [Ferrithrix thermotolerans DSM 19514]|uniref:CDP-diacylglycerol--glycerol-3-phosphate 3-phosphatidyltransferase n=1 Tax=Ferrithrix thermotolerans DSM 19514 TaxID=1121881 RepID=A0A1M4UGG5_9ACTN|nr:CDP-alcohol phosphatidyltransferase family protein [Ferrithrix thermotolerans]SHE55673.1 CDP-diacylglycerol--glycerol-3-phosphate 3-phosphatidyltransferase [Ferrithrix thermotolerans DSM 19514]
MGVERSTDATGECGDAPRSHFLTVPNFITSLRLALLPFLVVLMQDRANPLEIASLLGFMGVTDFLDGFIARRIGAVSTFGKVFDPSSDRVVLVVVAIELLRLRYVPSMLAVLLLVRECFVSLLMIYLFIFKKIRVDVIWAGKAGTFALLTSLPMFVFLGHYGAIGKIIYTAGVIVASVGTVVLYYAASSYVRALKMVSVRSNHVE